MTDHNLLSCRQPAIISLALATLLAGGTPAQACLAEYRSPDWLVATSPLIIIGEVEAVDKLTLEGADKGSLGGMLVEKQNPDKPGPSAAKVRVLRILKGRFKGTHVQIVSGPIRSCAPWPVHFTFTVGQKSIFLLPAAPQDGTARLVWGGSMRELQDTEMIEARIARAGHFRAKYVADVQRELPEIHAAAVVLAGKMRAAAPQWPELVPKKDRNVVFYEEDAAFKDAKAALVKDLAKVHVEAIRIAAALEPPDEDATAWWRRALWESALRDVSTTRAAEIAKAEGARIRRVLTSAGVDRKLIDRYLADVKENEFDRSLEFPPDAPYAHRDRGSEVLTTDFILRYHEFDRGSMFVAYGMRFEVLTKLDAKRVETIIPAMYASSDERLSLVAYRAIERIPGTTFVEVIFDDVFHRKPTAWRALIAPGEKGQAKDETARRLSALLEMAPRNLSSWAVPYFWRALRRGECFEETCLNKAIEHLKALEKRPGAEEGGKEGKPDEASQEAAELAGALREYLAAAVLHRGGKADKALGAGAFADWFKAHPVASPSSK